MIKILSLIKMNLRIVNYKLLIIITMNFLIILLNFMKSNSYIRVRAYNTYIINILICFCNRLYTFICIL